MKNDKPTFKELLAESRRKREKSLTDHPTYEKLAAFQEGELPVQDADVILRHLGVCTNCTDQLLFCGDFPSPGESLSVRYFTYFRQVLAAVARWLWPSDRLVWNLARSAIGAAAAYMLVVPSLRLDQANKIIAKMSRPQSNVEIFHVKRPVRGLEAGSADTVYEISAEDYFFAVTISVESGFEPRQIRILDRNGKEIWKSRDLSLDPLGVHLRLGLSRHSLDPGEYLIEVSGFEDGARVSPRLYPVHFEYR